MSPRCTASTSSRIREGSRARESPVTPTRLLSELETVAARLGIALRVERLGAEVLGRRGGLCRIRGRTVILVDESLPIADRISVLAEALSAFDVSSIYVPPVVRARIEDACRRPASVFRCPSR